MQGDPARRRDVERVETCRHGDRDGAGVGKHALRKSSAFGPEQKRRPRTPDDLQEGLAAFAEKRAPNFKGK